MRPVRITKALIAGDDNVIADTQTPAGAGNLTLITTTGVALDTPRRVLITTAADEHTKTFTIYGNQNIDGTGNNIQESIIGPAIAGSVYTAQDFGLVTRVAVSAALSNTVKVGTNTIGSTPWQLVDHFIIATEQSINVNVTGSVNYTVEYTYDDIMGQAEGGVWTSANLAAIQVLPDPILVTATADGDTTFDNPITAWRVTINSGTGSIVVTGIQAGIANS